MNPIQSPYLKQNPTTLGALGGSNSPFLSTEDYKINLDYSNYLRQSGVEALGRATGNIIGNTALEAIRGVGSLYELGKRGSNLIDSKDFSVNNLLFGNFDKEDNDFGNVLTKFAEKHQNPFGEVYTRTTDTFDVTSPAWWLKQGQSVLPTILEFAGESALLGTGIARGALKLAEFLNTGVRGAKVANNIAQGLTAFAVTKHESYMMAAQTYDKVYKDYLNRFANENPFAGEEELKAIEQKAKQAAGQAASAVDGIYSTLALPFNVTGLGSIFGKEGNAIYDYFRKGAGSKLGKEEIEALSIQNPYVAKLLQKESAFNASIPREMFFEGFEELEGQFSQEAGENFKDGKRANIATAIDQLENFFKYTLNEEGALNFFMGGFAGGAQTAILENIPIHKVNRLNMQGKPDIVYNDKGEPVVQKQWVNSRTRDVYGKQIMFNNYKEAIQHDLNHISNIQDRIKVSTNPIEKEHLKRELFHLQAFDSVKKGLGENLINSIKQIVDVDNSKPLVDETETNKVVEELQAQIQPFTSKENKEKINQQLSQLQGELDNAQSDEQAGQLNQTIQELNEKLTYPEDEQIGVQNIEIQKQIDQVNKQFTEGKDKTQAIQAGLATDKQDNSYKDRGLKAIEQIRKTQRFYDSQTERFGKEGQQLQLAEYTTELYGTILGNEQLIADWSDDIAKEKANIGLFAQIDDLVELDNYYKLHSSAKEDAELNELADIVQKYVNDPKDKKNQEALQQLAGYTGQDVWNEEQLAKALKEEQLKLLNVRQEKLDLLNNDLRNSQSYKTYLGNKEDSDSELENYKIRLFEKSKDINDFAELNNSLENYKTINQHLKDKLTEVTSSSGSEKFIRNALQKVEYAKELLSNQINTLSYNQARSENKDHFFVSKIKHLSTEHIQVIEREIDAIKTKIRDLVTQTDKSSIKTYFDSFLEKYVKAKTNEEKIQAYEARIEQLEEYKTQILDKQNQEIKEVKKAQTQIEKAKVVSKKEEQIKSDEEYGVDVTSPEDISVFGEEEFQVSEDQTPEETPIVEPVVETKVESPISNPTVQIDLEKHKKRLKSIKDLLDIDPVKFIQSNYTELAKLKGVKEVLDYLVANKYITKYDSEDEIDIDIAKKISNIVNDSKPIVVEKGEQTEINEIANNIVNIYNDIRIKKILDKVINKEIELQPDNPSYVFSNVLRTESLDKELTQVEKIKVALELSKLGFLVTGNINFTKNLERGEDILAKTLTADVIQKVEEVAKEVKQTVDATKDLGDFLFANKTNTIDRNTINKLIIDYLDVKLKKTGKLTNANANETVKDTIDFFTSKLNLSKSPRDQYNLGIKASAWLYDVSKLDKYNEEIKAFEAKLVELSKPQVKVEPVPVEESIPDVEENEPENLDKEQVKQIEEKQNRISNSVIPNFISFKSQATGNKFKLEEKYKRLFDPSYLNIGDVITLRSGKKEGKTSENLEIEIFKGNESIGNLPANIFSRLQYSIRFEKKNIALFEQIKQETIPQQEQLKVVRDLFFNLPDGTSIETTISEKGGGFHLTLDAPKLLSESKLLKDEQLSLLLADNGRGVEKDVAFRESTNEVISVDDISNYDSYGKSLPKVSLWIKYPNSISGKFNIIPATIGTIEQDFSTLRDILIGYSKGSKQILTTVNTVFKYDLTKPRDLEAFINQYFVFTYNNKSLDKKEKGLTVFNDGNLALKFGGTTTYFEKGKKNSEFFDALDKFAKVANKNVTLNSTKKNYKNGINQRTPFLAPVFKDGLLTSVRYSNYNEYISQYVSTTLTPSTNTPTTNSVYYTAPLYVFDQSKLINNLSASQPKPVVKEIEEVLDEGLEFKNLLDDFDANPDWTKSLSASRIILQNLNKEKFYDLNYGKGMLKGATSFFIPDKLRKNQGGYASLVNRINKLNRDEFEGFPVLQTDGKEVYISENTLSVYQKINSTNEFDINQIDLYRTVQKLQGLKDQSLRLVQIANSKTKENLGKVLKLICN